MDNKVIVDAEGLREVSNQLATNADKLADLYRNDISSVLNSCSSELKISGLDYSNVSESFRTMFSNLENQIRELVDALNNTIIPGYNLSAQSITRLFNNDFANRINEYMTVIKKDL